MSSPATVRKAWQIAAQIIGQAVEDGRLARSPLPRRMELPRSERGDLRIPNPDEVVLLADSTDERYRVMVLTAAFAGLRFGEAAALRTESVDLLRRSITVIATLSEVRGEVRIGPPKTKRSRRRIAIGRVLADEVGTQIGQFGCDGWIFPAPDGSSLRSSNFGHRVWTPAIQRSGLEGLRFHDLRHAHAAMLIQQGEHPRLISERLGHSSITVTLDVYGSLFPGTDEEAANRLDHLMDSTPSTRRAQSVSQIVR